jgi:hypothetical protein
MKDEAGDEQLLGLPPWENVGHRAAQRIGGDLPLSSISSLHQSGSQCGRMRQETKVGSGLCRGVNISARSAAGADQSPRNRLLVATFWSETKENTFVWAADHSQVNIRTGPLGWGL